MTNEQNSPASAGRLDRLVGLYMVNWIKQQSNNEKYVAELDSGEHASIMRGGKHCKKQYAVCIYGNRKIYPHTVRNYNSVDDCKKFVDDYLMPNTGGNPRERSAAK